MKKFKFWGKLLLSNGDTEIVTKENPLIFVNDVSDDDIKEAKKFLLGKSSYLAGKNLSGEWIEFHYKLIKGKIMNSYKVSGKFLIDGKEIKIKDENAINCYAVDSKQADEVVENHLLDKYDGNKLEWVIKHTVLTQVGRKE